MRGQEENEEQNIFKWSGLIEPPPIPNINFSIYMLDIMREHGDKLAVVDTETGQGRTYKELCDLVPRVAGSLVTAGVKPGHHILLLLPAHMEYPLLLLSILYCGAVCVPINPHLTQDELVHVLNVSEPQWALVHESAINVLEGARTQMGKDCMRGVWIIGGSHKNTGLPSLQNLISHQQIPPVTKVDDVSKWVGLMPFSSGTTGLPKGVLITHQGLLLLPVRNSFMDKVRELNGQPHQSIRQLYKGNLISLPVAHLYGHGSVISTLQYGGTVYFLTRFSPKPYFHAIQKYKITVSSLVPHLAKFLSETPIRKNYDTSSIMGFFSAGAPLPPDTPMAVMKKTGHGIVSAYGMTEAFSVVTSHTLQTQLKHPTSVGYIVPYVEIKIVDVERGTTLPENKEGEICVKCPSLMLGYAKNPAATFEAIDTRGWLHTGDIGYFEEGLLYITDRIKDLIKVKGHQVAPTEIENILKLHPDVADAAVVGIADERTGEAPRAYVVPRKGANIDTGELADFVAERTVGYKHLTGGIEVVNLIPRNPTGKILRKKLLKNSTLQARL